MPVDAAVELAGDAADGRLVADVGRPQAAGGQAAEALARLDQHHRLAHPRRLHRRRHAGGRAAVDHHVITVSAASAAEGRASSREEKASSRHGRVGG